MPSPVLRLLRRWEALRDTALSRLGRATAVLPWLSLAYGAATGLMLKRDHAHSTALVAWLAVLVLAQVALRAWLAYAARGVDAVPEHRAALRELVARPELVERFGHGFTRYAAQYITMFCAPLLYLASAWTTLALSVAVATASMWDGWWRRIAQRPALAALARAFCAVLATSFALAVLAPAALPWFYPTLGAVALASALPWGAVADRRRPRRRELAPTLLVLVAVAWQAAIGSWLRVPLLSVWLKAPAIGAGIAERELRRPFGKTVRPADLEAALARGEGVCCLTPVVSPSGVRAPVVHEWRVDDRLVERIALPPVRGLAGEAAFRTYSCKQHLPSASTFTRLRCRVLLDDTIYLGETQVAVGSGI